MDTQLAVHIGFVLFTSIWAVNIWINVENCKNNFGRVSAAFIFSLLWVCAIYIVYLFAESCLYIWEAICAQKMK